MEEITEQDLEECKNYLRVDYDDDDELIKFMICASMQYVTNGFNTYDKENFSHKILMLKALKTLYDNRGECKNSIEMSIKLQQSLGGPYE